MTSNGPVELIDDGLGLPSCPSSSATRSFEADGVSECEAGCEADGEADGKVRGILAHGGDPSSPTACSSPKANRKVLKKKRTTNNRVSWDEKAIAEHDKERGTRQKIDEPDTPFIRSPTNVSDDEVQEGGSPVSPKVLDLDHKDVSNKLSEWMLNTSLQDKSRGSGTRVSGSSCGSEASADEGYDTRSRPHYGNRRGSDSSDVESDASSAYPSPKCPYKGERRVSLPEESEDAEPKTASKEWKAKRAQHYDEIAALRAGRDREGYSDPETPLLSDQESGGLLGIGRRPSVGFQEDPAPELRNGPAPDGSRSAADDDSRTDQDRSAFESARKGHYGNMAAALREARALMDDDDEDSSEDEPR